MFVILSIVNNHNCSWLINKFYKKAETSKAMHESNKGKNG